MNTPHTKLSSSQQRLRIICLCSTICCATSKDVCVCVLHAHIAWLSLYSCISHGWTDYHFDIHLICVEGLLDTLLVLCLTPVRVYTLKKTAKALTDKNAQKCNHAAPRLHARTKRQ